MAAKIAFWNINTGKGSVKERKQTITAWCAWAQPDLLILEEVSNTLSNLIEGMTKLDEVVHVETLTKKRKKSTKEIWALQKSGGDFKGYALRLPKLHSVRMGVKVTSKNLGLQIWGLHANASNKGGRAAVDYADSYLKTNTKALIGGDFNYAITKAQNRIQHSTICTPESWENNDLNFSQWRTAYGKRIKPDPYLHLQNNDVGLCKPLPSPNGVIDYAMYGSNRKVLSLQNCQDEDMWVEILKWFDHCPVMFSVT